MSQRQPSNGGSSVERRWHALRAEEALAAMDSDPDSGLSADEVERRRARFGPNAFREPKRRPMVWVFIDQFRSPLIYLLLVAALTVFLLGHVRDSIVICAVLVLNAIIGSIQEGRAERSLMALRKLAKHKALVVRDGEEVEIDARDVVPGDILMLRPGDAVAADARLIDATALQISEASLTGESVPVGKDLVPVGPDAPLADRHNMVFSGTHVTAGHARAVVVATGAATEIGHIATLTEEAEEPKTPLELRIAQLGRHIIAAAGVLLVLVVLVGSYHGIPFSEVLMLGIAQVVSVVPEGLPVAMTIALAVGVQRMVRRKTVVRRLAAVETLGSVTIICTDKTGTLTKNEMTAKAVFLPSGRELSVTGSGYEPIGEFREGDRVVDPEQVEGLRELLEAVTLCNDSDLHGPDEDEPHWKPIGDPTEVALLSLAIKGGIVPRDLRAKHPRQAEIPFHPAARMMATQHGRRRVVLKGAPEEILELCGFVRKNGDTAPLDEEGRRAVRDAVDRMANAALRILAIATVEDVEIEGDLGFEAFRGRAIFLGLVGQIDPPREEVEEAIRQGREAGIEPVMVTGDYKPTGQAIAKQLGIAREGDVAIDGRELEALSDDELADRIEKIAVFARVHPAQKLRIVDAFQRRGHVVAMTGDGVNDAPALAKADVGVAMGMTGTDVAKEASEIVIGDDNFATIVAAVEEGRVVYRNLKKLILYLFATSMVEVVVLFTALLFGYPPPLQAVQILWVNLVADGMLSVTLIMEPPEGDEMQRPPVPRNEPIFTWPMLRRVAIVVSAMFVSTLGWFLYRLSAGAPFPVVQTETFTILAVCQWFNGISCRSELRSVFTMRTNRWLLMGLAGGVVLQALVIFFRPLGRVFHTVPIELDELGLMVALASLVLWVEELRKLVARKRRAHERRRRAQL